MASPSTTTGPAAPSAPRILIIGAGSRGNTYAEATTEATGGVVVAVAETDVYKREALGRQFIWGPEGRNGPAEGEAFADWTEFVAYERTRRKRAAVAEEKSSKITDGNMAPFAGTVPPGVDAVFVCVLDEMHRAVVEALVDLGGLHIMCEKPLATTRTDCKAIYQAALRGQQEGRVFAVGHVLRYSPHNRLLRRLVREQCVIGDVLSVVHTEPVGWWHFAHSYVRGNWRREQTSAPSLLTKSCHDMDVLLWLLCSPTSLTDNDAASDGRRTRATAPHLPARVSSSGGLLQFRRSRKPRAAGTATNCLACPAEPACQFSARRIYVDGQLRGLGTGNTRWPVKIVVPDIEEIQTEQGPAQARAALLTQLTDDYGPDTPDTVVAARNWFGRCVFEADNDVCDDQVVVISWDDDAGGDDDTKDNDDPMADRLGGRGAKTATFHMVAQTQRICQRYTHLYGVHGEIYADEETITVQDFRDGSTVVHRPTAEVLKGSSGTGHGGGDMGLTRQFVAAVDAVKNQGMPAETAQRVFVGCTLEEMLRSHALVFCADEARRTRTVLDWEAWWAREIGVE